MKVINLFGGPGTGKSTTAAGLFHLMKLEGYNVELVTEFAKDLTWDKRHQCLQDQIYIFAKQNKRLNRIKDQVDYAITDSPLLLSHIYAEENYYESFKKLVDEVYVSYDNLNIFLCRTKPYNPVGRNQTEEEARKIDDKILKMFRREEDRILIDAGYNAPLEVLNEVRRVQWKDYRGAMSFDFVMENRSNNMSGKPFKRVD